MDTKEINAAFVRKGDVFDVVFLREDMSVHSVRVRYIGRDEKNQPILKDVDPTSRIPNGPITTLGVKKVEP